MATDTPDAPKRPRSAKPAAAKTTAAKAPAKSAAKPAGAKPAAARKPVVKRAPASPPASPQSVTEHMRELVAEAPAVLAVVKSALSLKKKELIERVTALSGEKKKSVKDIVEATLAVLGEALEKGEELILPPLGKAKVNRSKDNAGGTTLMVKLRRNEGKASGKAAKEALADADD